jgi:DNA-directed RNA polymerase subunit alpha
MNVSKILSFFTFPQNVICEKSSLTDRYAKFYIEPFDKGISTTVANSLRRFFLSSIPGYAISAVSIDGIVHEFSPIEGAKEDYTDFVLNLKQVRLKLLSESDKKEVFIHLKGEGVFKSGDLPKFDSDIVVLNPDLVLLNLNKDADIRIKIIITYGRGFALADEIAKNINEIGLIPIDALYSPIEKVNFNIETVRYGISFFERIVLEVETDGTISPIDAYKIVVEVFKASFRNISDIDISDIEPSYSADKNLMDIREMVKKLSSSVDELNLSSKISNILKESGINTVYDLVSKHKEELKFKSFGKKSIEEVEEKLKEWNLGIGMHLPKEVIEEFENDRRNV